MPFRNVAEATPAGNHSAVKTQPFAVVQNAPLEATADAVFRDVRLRRVRGGTVPGKAWPHFAGHMCHSPANAIGRQSRTAQKADVGEQQRGK